MKLATAKAKDVPISTKQSVEISNYLRYKNTLVAKRLLEEALSFHRAIPFKRFNRDMGHKPGMAAGRYPQKATRYFLDLIKSAEANAKDKGLDANALKITKIFANRAAIPMTGARHRHSTKRTHLEIEVKEVTKK